MVERFAIVTAVLASCVVSFSCRRREVQTQVDAAPPPTTVASAQPSDAAPPPRDPCAITGSRLPLLVRWTAEQRRALIAATQDGVVVVAADDCRGVRLLPKCRVPGRYGYSGFVRQSTAVDLANEEELRINAPLAASAAADAGVAPLHVEHVVVGRRTTLRQMLARDELTGECTGATHYVKYVDLGALAGTQKGAKPASSCHDGQLDDKEPPAACDTPVVMRIDAIADDAVVDYVQGYADEPVAIGTCPQGMVVSKERCVRPPVDAPFLCAFGDAKVCREQCDRGDVNSCDVFALMAWKGKGLAKDGALAASVYTKACEANDGIACANVAVMLHGGDGVAKDAAKAVALFDRACKLGARDACANLAVAYTIGSGVVADKSRASAILERACDAGSAEACVALAKALLRGDFAAPDPKRAIALLDELCVGSDAFACFELGRQYVLGEHVPVDHARAAKLSSRACRAGNDAACVVLGLMHRQADGVPRDDVLATRLFGYACSHGHSDGCHNLAIAYEYGKGIPMDMKRAIELYEKACSAGFATSCLFLSDFIAAGTFVAKDEKRASELRAKACSLGEQRACAQ